MLYSFVTHRRNRKWVNVPNPPDTARRFRACRLSTDPSIHAAGMRPPRAAVRKFLFRKLQRFQEGHR